MTDRPEHKNIYIPSNVEGRNIVAGDGNTDGAGKPLVTNGPYLTEIPKDAPKAAWGKDTVPKVQKDMSTSQGEVIIGGIVDATSAVVVGNNMNVKDGGVHIGKDGGKVTIRGKEYPTKVHDRINRYIRQLASGSISFKEMHDELLEDKIEITLEDVMARYPKATKDVEGARPILEIAQELAADVSKDILSIKQELRKIMRNRPLREDERKVWDEIAKREADGKLD